VGDDRRATLQDVDPSRAATTDTAYFRFHAATTRTVAPRRVGGRYTTSNAGRAAHLAEDVREVSLKTSETYLLQQHYGAKAVGQCAAWRWRSGDRHPAAARTAVTAFATCSAKPLQRVHVSPPKLPPGRSKIVTFHITTPGGRVRSKRTAGLRRRRVLTGWVVLICQPARPSMNFYESLEAVEAVARHGGLTRIASISRLVALRRRAKKTSYEPTCLKIGCNRCERTAIARGCARLQSSCRAGVGVGARISQSRVLSAYAAAYDCTLR